MRPIDWVVLLVGGPVLYTVALLVLGLLGVIEPGDLRDEVWPQRQEAPACPPPAAPTGGHAYG